jgi:DNA modification methylase
MNAAGPVFGDPINMAVWVKDRAGMGSFLRSQHELVLIYCTPGATYRNNVELGRHGRNRTNVWKYPSAMSFAHSGAEGDLLDDHPTPKPKDMVADAILDCTARGAVVLDPFIGSGSTLIASEKTGRVCRGMDLDPLYVDLAVRRWQAWTGQQAVHAHDARRFDDIGQETAASLEGASHD